MDVILEQLPAEHEAINRFKVHTQTDTHTCICCLRVIQYACRGLTVQARFTGLVMTLRSKVCTHTHTHTHTHTYTHFVLLVNPICLSRTDSYNYPSSDVINSPDENFLLSVSTPLSGTLDIGGLFLACSCN